MDVGHQPAERQLDRDQRGDDPVNDLGRRAVTQLLGRHRYLERVLTPARQYLPSPDILRYALCGALFGCTGAAAARRFDAHRLAGPKHEARYLRRQFLFVGAARVAHETSGFAGHAVEDALGACQVTVAAAAEHRTVFQGADLARDTEPAARYAGAARIRHEPVF